jgi:hypothetical protein
LAGTDAHGWASYCHFHPAARVTGRGDSWLRLERGAAILDVCWYGAADASLVIGQHDPLLGWYAERFGPAVPAPVLVLTGHGALPVRFGYALVPQASPADPPASIELSPIGERRIRIDFTTFPI